MKNRKIAYLLYTLINILLLPSVSNATTLDASGHLVDLYNHNQRIDSGVSGPSEVSPDFYETTENAASGDYTAAFSQAISDLSKRGGGVIVLEPHVYHIVKSDLVLPENVSIRGYQTPGVPMDLDYRKLPYTISIDPGYSIKPSSKSSIDGIVIIPSTLGKPSDTASMVAELNTWATNGTAIEFSTTSESPSVSKSDVVIKNNLIIGFNQAIHSSYSERTLISHNTGDNINGISVNYCLDICRIENNHFNSLINYTQSYGGEWVPVGSITNNGSGQIRITVPSGYSFDFKNGYTVTGWSDSNTGNINGKFTVSNVTSTTFDLTGSTYTTDVTGGTSDGSIGKIYLDNSARQGVGFYITHCAGLYMSNNYAGGYRNGFYIGDGATWVFGVNNSADGYLPAHDPDKIGIMITGTAQRAFLSGGYISSAYNSIVVNTTDQTPHIIQNMNIGATFNSALIVQNGSVLASGNVFVGAAPIYLSSSITTPSSFVNNSFGGSVIKNASSLDISVLDSVNSAFQNAHISTEDITALHSTKTLSTIQGETHTPSNRQWCSDCRSPTQATGAGTGRWIFLDESSTWRTDDGLKASN